MLLILAWFTFLNKEETCLVQESGNSDTALFKQLQKTCAPVATHCVYVHQNRGNHEEFLTCSQLWESFHVGRSVTELPQLKISHSVVPY